VAAFANKTVFVTIAYAEADTDPRTANGVTDAWPMTETPSVQISDTAPLNPVPTRPGSIGCFGDQHDHRS
jgi:hypothetical protein